METGKLDITQANAYLVLSDRLGRGDDELGALLMKNLLYALARTEEPPREVLFMNHAVKLACAGSASIEDLELLVEAGCAVKSCGTCLDFLGLKEQLAVGVAGTMPEAVTMLQSGDAVVIG
jgi:selenium metabolism protein YedF